MTQAGAGGAPWVYSQTLDVTQQYGNSNTEHVLYEPALITVGHLKASSCYLWHAAGNIDGKAASGSFTLLVYCNNVLASTILVGLNQTAQGAGIPWFLVGDIYFDTLGVTGTISVVSSNCHASAAGLAQATLTVNTLNTVVDLRAGAQLSFRSIMQTADALNMFRLDRLTLRSL